MTRDHLDKLLEQWAAQHATDEGHARVLAERIVDELSRDGSPNLNVTAARPGRTVPPRKYLYPALAASVALMIFAGALFVRYGGRPPTVLPGDDTAARAAIVPPSDIEAGGRLFREMGDLFSDELRWVAESDSKVRLGIHQVSGGRIAGAAPLLIRVLVLQRGRGETSWRTLLATDVLTRSQELVEVAADPTADNRLALWTHVLPDGKVAVDSNIRLTSPIRACVNATNILSPGKPARLFSLQTEDAEYHIFQVVIPLPKPGDEPC